MCALGHICLSALPHTDQYGFYSWPLDLEAGDSLPLSLFPIYSLSSALPRLSACPLCWLSRRPLSLFPSFPPPDNTKGTLSSSQLDSGSSSGVSGEHQTRDSFWGITEVIGCMARGIGRPLGGLTHAHRHVRTCSLARIRTHLLFLL